MRLSIVIVAWNVRRQLADCLESIGRYPPGGKFEVIVVDNASTDGTVEAVRRDFPWVTIFANEQNRGFAAANNRGLAVAQGEYLLLLNPDTIVHPHALETLCRFLQDHPDVDACGPRLLNKDGTLQPSAHGLPTFRASLHRHTIFRYFLVFRRQHRQWRMSSFPYDRQMDVDQLMGAALLLRRTALDQIGRLDERFFMYYEEVDLCHRLKQAGRRTVFVPEATITHLMGESSRQVPVATQIMMLDSLLRYLRKHRGRVAMSLFNCVFKPGVIAQWLWDFVTGVFQYLASWLIFDPARRRKSTAKVRKSAVLLGKHSWWLLFKA
jgi:hypothetical protein